MTDPTNDVMVLQVGTGEIPTYENMGTFTNVKPWKLSGGSIEVFNMESADMKAKYIPGTKISTSEMSGTLYYLGTETWDAQINTVLKLKLLFPNGKAATFEGIITSWEVQASDTFKPDSLKAAISIQPATVPVVA